MRRARRSAKVVNQMNVVPYIDVMLVLLIIFMVTAPMFTPSVINLPSVGKASNITTEPIEIGIDAEGHYSLTQNHQQTQYNSIDEATKSIVDINDNTSLVIAADKEVKYDLVVSAIDSLHQAGIKKVALVVKNKE